MGLASDRNYVNLARRAAGRLGTSNGQIVTAILAQWQCELGAGDAYPPRRNNPGNLSRGAAQTIGARYTIEPGSNPQPGNPIVTFPSPEAGADAYAKLLATTARYADVRAAARAGDGRAYLQAINRSGYGGSLSCTLSVFGGQVIPGSGGSVGGAGLPGLPGPGGVVLVGAPTPAAVAASLAALQAKLRSIGVPSAPSHQFTAAEAMLVATKLYHVSGSVADSIAHYWAGTTVQHQAELAASGDVQSTNPIPTTDDVLKALFGDFGWVPGVAANLAVLTAIGVLGYVGLTNLAAGLGEG